MLTQTHAHTHTLALVFLTSGGTMFFESSIMFLITQLSSSVCPSGWGARWVESGLACVRVSSTALLTNIELPELVGTW